MPQPGGSRSRKCLQRMNRKGPEPPKRRRTDFRGEGAPGARATRQAPPPPPPAPGKPRKQNCSDNRNKFILTLCEILKCKQCLLNCSLNVGLSRSLRSTNKVVLNYNLEAYRKRALSFIAPILWNNLPVDIRTKACLSSFKTRVKTFFI